MAVEGGRDSSSTYPVMAACCLLMLVDKAAAPSDPRLIELLQKLKEPSRDRLLKVVVCTQVSPDRDLKLGQLCIGSDRSICVEYPLRTFFHGITHRLIRRSSWSAGRSKRSTRSSNRFDMGSLGTIPAESAKTVLIAVDVLLSRLN
jgi:hypothetical protein